MFADLTATRYRMPNHSSYHGGITGRVAEERLQKNGGVCYLTRYSTRQRKYVFSVIDSKANVHHIEILIDQDVPLFSLKNTEKRFASMKELFKYYPSGALGSHAIHSNFKINIIDVCTA